MIDADVSVDSIVNDDGDDCWVDYWMSEWVVDEDYSWMLHVAQHYQQPTSTEALQISFQINQSNNNQLNNKNNTNTALLWVLIALPKQELRGSGGTGRTDWSILQNHVLYIILNNNYLNHFLFLFICL